MMADGVYAETVVEPVTSESFVASTEAVTDSYPVDDVVRVVSDPAVGPKLENPDSPQRAKPNCRLIGARRDSREQPSRAILR